MAIKQISVFLENKPGTLKEMTKVLANAGVDMNALSLAETKDFGIVRINLEYMYASLGGKKQNDAYMILRVENCEKAESALRAGGIYVLSQENASDM